MAGVRCLFFLQNKRIREHTAHDSKVQSVAWSCDGRRLASGSFDKTVSVFQLDNDRDRMVKDCTFRGHSNSVDQLCWHPKNPDQLLTASGDKTIRIWDARTNRSVATFNTKSENINICWSPDGSTIAVGNMDDLITFIDVRSHRSKAEEQFKFEVNEISWNNYGDLFFLTSGQGSINILSYPDLKLQHTLNAHPANCICIEFDPKGKYFATGSADALVSIWDIAELACIRTLSRLEWPVRTLSFSHDGKMLASASKDLIIDIAKVDSVSLVEAVYLEYARLLANLGLRAPAKFYCQKASDKGRQLKEEEFDSGYHSFSDNASMINECSYRYFDDLCVFESIVDCCLKLFDILEAKTMSSAEIVSSAINFKPTKHQCPVCGKTYGGKTKLNYHMATHTGIRPHKCSICGKAFTQKSTLRTHFRIHTGEKPYKCRTCTRAFGDYFTSMKHERTHSGEKPYACPECGKCFTQSRNMLRHRHTLQKKTEIPQKVLINYRIHSRKCQYLYMLKLLCCFSFRVCYYCMKSVLFIILMYMYCIMFYVF
uniref:THO complex subunit 3 n=1 Tax=Magallana gigas TaxID=29159 RepID=K1RW24_MAGGI